MKKILVFALFLLCSTLAFPVTFLKVISGSTDVYFSYTSAQFANTNDVNFLDLEFRLFDVTGMTGDVDLNVLEPVGYHAHSIEYEAGETNGYISENSLGFYLNYSNFQGDWASFDGIFHNLDSTKTYVLDVKVNSPGNSTSVSVLHDDFYRELDVAVEAENFSMDMDIVW